MAVYHLHGLVLWWSYYIFFCRPRARIIVLCQYQTVSFVLLFPVLYLIPRCGTSVIRTCMFSQCTLYSGIMTLYMYFFHLPCIFIVYHYSCSVISLSSATFILWDMILSSAWLVVTDTVKQTYGQWLVYGEFNNLGFVSRVQLVYKS